MFAGVAIAENDIEHLEVTNDKGQRAVRRTRRGVVAEGKRGHDRGNERRVVRHRVPRRAVEGAREDGMVRAVVHRVELEGHLERRCRWNHTFYLERHELDVGHGEVFVDVTFHGRSIGIVDNVRRCVCELS